MTDTEHLLEIQGISRSFGSLRALDDVDLAIRRNEFFALLGPSGCGKTTLLRILAGFDHPDAGTITLSGQDLLGIRPNRRPVNLMFQSYALFPHMSVEKNVAYGLEREGVAKDEVRERVQEVLDDRRAARQDPPASAPALRWPAPASRLGTRDRQTAAAAAVG